MKEKIEVSKTLASLDHPYWSALPVWWTSGFGINSTNINSSSDKLVIAQLPNDQIKAQAILTYALQFLGSVINDYLVNGDRREHVFNTFDRTIGAEANRLERIFADVGLEPLEYSMAFETKIVRGRRVCKYPNPLLIEKLLSNYGIQDQEIDLVTPVIQFLKQIGVDTLVMQHGQVAHFMKHSLRNITKSVLSEAVNLAKAGNGVLKIEKLKPLFDAEMGKVTHASIMLAFGFPLDTQISLDLWAELRNDIDLIKSDMDSFAEVEAHTNSPWEEISDILHLNHGRFVGPQAFAGVDYKPRICPGEGGTRIFFRNLLQLFDVNSHHELVLRPEPIVIPFNEQVECQPSTEA